MNILHVLYTCTLEEQLSQSLIYCLSFDLHSSAKNLLSFLELFQIIALVMYVCMYNVIADSESLTLIMK